MHSVEWEKGHSVSFKWIILIGLLEVGQIFVVLSMVLVFLQKVFLQ